MKMNVLFLIYLIIFMCSTTLASKSNSLENIVSELVELNKLAGKSPESITMLVSKMSSSLEAVQNKEAKFFNRAERNCKSGNQIAKGYLEKLKSDLVENNVTINLSIQKSAEAQESKKKLKSQVADLKSKFQDLDKQINKEWEKFRRFASENEQKLVTIKYVKDIITDELLAKHDSGSSTKINTKSYRKSNENLEISNNKSKKKSNKKFSKNSDKKTDARRNALNAKYKGTKYVDKKKNRKNKRSFVQVNTEELAQRVEDLKTMLNGLSSKESVYSTMAVTLLEVAEKKGFSNFKLLNKLVEIFEKLEKNLVKFRSSWEKSEKKIIKDLEVQVKSVKQQIRTVMGMYKEASSIVKESKKLVEYSENIKKSIQGNIERNMIQNRHWDKICDYEAKLKAKSFLWSTSLMHKINKLSADVSRI